MKMKNLICLALVGVGLAWAFGAFGDELPPAPAPATEVPTVTPDSGGTAEVVSGVIVSLAQKYPWALTVLAVVGALRLLVKPVIAAAHSYAESTATPKDDEFLAKVENSKVLKGVLFVVELVTSIKPRR